MRVGFRNWKQTPTFLTWRWPAGTHSKAEGGFLDSPLCLKDDGSLQFCCREEANSDSVLKTVSLACFFVVAFVIIIMHNSLPQRTLLLCLTVNRRAFVQLREENLSLPTWLCVQLPSRVWLCRGPPGSSVHGVLQARILEGLPFPPPGDLPHPGVEHLLHWQADSLLLSHWAHLWTATTKRGD